MTLLNLLKNSADAIRDKTINQLIGLAGDGSLKDDSQASSEFREYLAAVPSEQLRNYSGDCLYMKKKFEDGGFALQDIVNEMGSRLGFEVQPGRYRGTKDHVGHDGLWIGPEGHALVIEVKTTDTYRIRLDTIAEYRRKLAKSGDLDLDRSSMLIVVGREDTGDLEAQIRGSKHSWDIRLVSVDALGSLLEVKEDVEEPETAKRIRMVLNPLDYTRLDGIVELVFQTKKDKEDLDDREEDFDDQGVVKKGPKSTPVNFHQDCVDVIQAHLGINLIKRSRATFVSADGQQIVVCAISREHDPETTPGYWFAFHPHQKELLEAANSGYVAFGCGSAKQIVVFSFEDFEEQLDSFNQTERKSGQAYWHVIIKKKEAEFFLMYKSGVDPRDISSKVLVEN